jgi:hypothetical protein
VIVSPPVGAKDLLLRIETVSPQDTSCWSWGHSPGTEILELVILSIYVWLLLNLYFSSDFF